MIRMQTYGMLDVTEGLKDLEKQLVALGANEGRKVLTRAARNAFAPVLEAAKQNAPVDTGLLRDNIVIVTQKPKEGDGVVLVGLRVKKSKETRQSKTGKARKPGYQSPHWRWHFAELKHPFMRPALDANADTVVGNLRGELAKAIARVLKKRAKEGVRGSIGRGLAQAKSFAKTGLKGFKRGFR